MKKITINQTTIIIPLVVFTALIAWWLWLLSIAPPGDNIYRYFTASYGVMAVCGAVIGLLASFRYGGLKSIIGTSLSFFSAGLFFQEFGQLSYNYYIYVEGHEVPYPSIGDIGYFGSVILYLVGTLFLIKALSTKSALNNLSNKLILFFVPLIIVVANYHFFLRNHTMDFTNFLVVFLDFGYPIGEGFYISAAIIAYLLSRKRLGGLMKPKILMLLAALCFQFIADFNFLFQAKNGTWVDGGYGEILYLIAYFIMSLALAGMLIDETKSTKITQKQ